MAVILVERALTLYEPWATLMALDKKRIETRCWKVPFRGWFGIHAAASFHPDDQALALTEPFASALAAAMPDGRPPTSRDELSDLPRRAVIAIAHLDDILRISATNAPAGDEYRFGNYTPGRFAWWTSRVYRLPEPIPVRGYQRLWRWGQEVEVPDELLADISISAEQVHPMQAAMPLAVP